MALCRQIVCDQCGKEREVWFSASGGLPPVCHGCLEANADVKKKQTLADLAALPIEQRLARIEEWIYDYKPQYVHPPVFG